MRSEQKRLSRCGRRASEHRPLRRLIPRSQTDQSQFRLLSSRTYDVSDPLMRSIHPDAWFRSPPVPTGLPASGKTTAAFRGQSTAFSCCGYPRSTRKGEPVRAGVVGTGRAFFLGMSAHGKAEKTQAGVSRERWARHERQVAEMKRGWRRGKPLPDGIKLAKRTPRACSR